MEREVLNQVNKEDIYKMHWSDISEHKEFKKGFKKIPKVYIRKKIAKKKKKKNPVPSVQFSCCRNQYTRNHTWRVGELRFITPAGPEELTLQSLSPE